MTKTRKKRKTRDPARPKRAMTPFLYYACEQRALLKSEGRKMSLTEQSRLIADRWKLVTNKTTYETKSEEDRARYRTQMLTYTPPYKIKRPRSSYAFFMKDVRADVAQKHPGKTPRELMSNVAAEWRSATEQTKSKYVIMAEEDKKRYSEEKKTSSA